MTETNKFESNSDLTLSNAAITRNNAEVPSLREAIPSTSNAVPTAIPPALPPRPNLTLQHDYGMQQGYNNYGMAGSYGMGGYGGYGYGGLGGPYGMGMGGMGAMGSYGGFNRYGLPGHGDIESRFIQMAEDKSRPAFDSIQGFVNAVGSVAMMLENTFFAMTSSFRAILGVAENFGRLRSLFSQFWSTLAVVRTLNWLIRKLMVMLGIRTENEFKAWAEAVAATQKGVATPEQQVRGSSWPILLFFGIVAAAPYIVLKMLSGLTSSINERLNDPNTWQNTLRAVALHSYEALSPQELSFSTDQVLYVAPEYLQTHIWNSGWVMATKDKVNVGLIPINYVRFIKPTVSNQNNTSSTEKSESSQIELSKYYEQGF